VRCALCAVRCALWAVRLAGGAPRPGRGWVQRAHSMQGGEGALRTPPRALARGRGGVGAGRALALRDPCVAHSARGSRRTSKGSPSRAATRGTSPRCLPSSSRSDSSASQQLCMRSSRPTAWPGPGACRGVGARGVGVVEWSSGGDWSQWLGHGYKGNWSQWLDHGY